VRDFGIRKFIKISIKQKHLGAVLLGLNILRSLWRKAFGWLCNHTASEKQNDRLPAIKQTHHPHIPPEIAWSDRMK
jgi:hypothetical protein